MLDFLSNPDTRLILVPLLPLAGFVINGFFGRHFSAKTSGAIATLAIGCAFALALSVACSAFFHGPQSIGPVSAHLMDWIQADWLSISFGFRLDQLSAVMALVITGVGMLIHLYSVGYMAHDKAYWRYFAYLNLFCFAMLCLVLGDNMVLMFLGWEGVGLCSYLLIGFWYEDSEKASAGKKAFVVNRIGDLGFLIGMFLIAWHFHSLDFTAINAAVPQAPDASTVSLLNWACFFLFIGAMGKSAQIPLYVWLPDAMAGPTPVSALIHAATMVTAGVYMLCRLNPLYELATWAPTIIAVVGAATAFFAGTIALVQRDIKKVLAYSTVSQLGFMFMAAGLGAYHFAIFHLVTHAFFKALLFLGSGSVIHALEHGYGHGNPEAQDLRLMGGLGKKMPITMLTMMVGGLALAGIPLFSGFFSKDEILLTAMHGNTLVYVLGVGAAACTAFYTARLLALTFFGTFRGQRQVYDHAHESPWTMTLPLMVLAVLALAGGYINLPHDLAHDADHLSRFLFAVLPEPHGDHGSGWPNMITSSVIAIVAFGVAFNYYRREGALGRAEAAVETGVKKSAFRLLLNKYWVDEIYDMAIVRPIRVMAQLLFVFFDMLLVDTVFVNGSVFSIGALSHLFRRVQTGLVTHYLYVFAAGAAGLMLWALLSI